MNSAKPKIRLYVEQSFAAHGFIPLREAQAHYLMHVMRAHAGEMVAVFNGKDGEWQAEISSIEKKRVTLLLIKPLAAQRVPADIWLAFAPIKNKTELVVEKAVELGVAKLMPVFTRHTVVKSVNMEKLEAHAIEAAEQCERDTVPQIAVRENLRQLLGSWPSERLLLYGDESGKGVSLKQLLPTLSVHAPIAILIGPEGGFAPEEHELLRIAPFVRPFSLGPRILRADTAAVAALACVQAWLGDWDNKPAENL